MFTKQRRKFDILVNIVESNNGRSVLNGENSVKYNLEI